MPATTEQKKSVAARKLVTQAKFKKLLAEKIDTILDGIYDSADTLAAVLDFDRFRIKHVKSFSEGKIPAGELFTVRIPFSSKVKIKDPENNPFITEARLVFAYAELFTVTMQRDLGMFECSLGGRRPSDSVITNRSLDVALRITWAKTTSMAAIKKAAKAQKDNEKAIEREKAKQVLILMNSKGYKLYDVYITDGQQSRFALIYAKNKMEAKDIANTAGTDDMIEDKVSIKIASILTEKDFDKKSFNMFDDVVSAAKVKGKMKISIYDEGT